MAGRGLCPAAAALMQLKLPVQRPAAAERPGGRDYGLPLSRRNSGISGGVRARIGHRAWEGWARCRTSGAWRPG